MVRIKRIDIINYRSCIKTRVDIESNLTTLIGINGVGKSNILNGVQLLKRINRNRYFHQKNLRDSLSHSKIDIWFGLKGEDFQLKSDIYYDTDETNTEEIYSAELKIKNISKKKSRWVDVDADLYQYLEYINRTRQTIQSIRSKNKKLNLESAKIAVETIRYLTNISYYSATQFSDPTKCPISLELEDSKPMRSFRRPSPHDQFIYDLYRTYKSENGSFTKYLNTVNQKGIGLIDDFTFFDHVIPSSSIKVRAGGQIQTIEKIKNIVVPSIKLDNLTLSPNQLSEGTFKTLALIFYILNDRSDLLLIEEPEVCVHHGLLGSIIELIRVQSRNKQIVISTHSDYVLDKLAPENVILVKKNKDTGTIAAPLTKALSKNDFKALKDYLKQSGNLGEYWKEGGFENE